MHILPSPSFLAAHYIQTRAPNQTIQFWLGGLYPIFGAFCPRPELPKRVRYIQFAGGDLGVQLKKGNITHGSMRQDDQKTHRQDGYVAGEMWPNFSPAKQHKQN